MNLIALTPVRNEAWILGASLRQTLKWCDEVIVLAHCCTDSTVDIVIDVAEEHAGRVHLIVEDNPNWAEMDHRQRLLEEARKRRASHIAIVDADEILTENAIPGVRDRIGWLRPGDCANVGMPCIWRSLEQYRTDPGIWANRSDLSLAFADHPNLRWQRDNGYDHHHRYPHGSVRTDIGHTIHGGVMHLQWASWRRLVAKQTWYQMMEVVKYPEKSPRDIASDYSRAMDEKNLRLSSVPAEWWDETLKRYIDLAAASWHERECERLLSVYGAARFAGLNLANLEAAWSR